MDDQERVSDQVNAADEHRDCSDDLNFSDPQILGRYEPYLAMLARIQMRRAYQAKLGASDMVQQVMIQAVAAFEGFNGNTEGELRAWLRQILARHLCHLDRDMHRDKRDVRREQSMEQKLAQSSMNLQGLLADHSQTTPSQNLMAGEAVLKMVEALDEIPEAQAEAIRMHYLEGMKLSEVAEALDKTPGSIAGLLHRGMKALRERLG
ncbi:MAG: sigma-70 family RNA polymerase sigma factor [Planctomycetota bacterium]